MSKVFAVNYNANMMKSDMVMQWNDYIQAYIVVPLLNL